MENKLAALKYPFNGLEPYLDAETVEIHYAKHHQTYLDKFLDAVKDHPDLLAMPAEDLLRDLSRLPEAVRKPVRNFGGGFANHNLFWGNMAPPSDKREPGGALLGRMEADLGGFDAFREAFGKAAAGIFGSGWAWLVENNGKLEITTTGNQDTPISGAKNPLLCLDVWEHSYYLKYRNRRAEYIEAWWSVVDWNDVEERFAKFFRA